jgi:hypothetical protein
MEWRQRLGNILSVGGDFPRRELGNGTAFQLEKMVSENHGKKSILNKKSLFFCVAALCKYMRAGDGGGGSKILLWAVISRFTRSHQK